MIRLLPTRLFITAAFTIAIGHVYAQYPTSCTSLGSRTNGNGQSNSCPNANGTPYASNFVGSAFTNILGLTKTGTLVFRYSNATAALKPYAITAVWSANPAPVPIPVIVGPASVPVVVGNDVEVTYCFYGTNLPNAGILSFRFTNPETGANYGICSYQANCASACAIQANPLGVTLPVNLLSISAIEKEGAVQLQWSTVQESNNKGFTVQRSTDAVNFSSLAFIDTRHANGNGNTTTAYSYIDNQTGNAQHLSYRLKQEDVDGNVTYSPTVHVRLSAARNSFRVYADQSAIHANSTTGNTGQYKMMVYDAVGRVVYSANVQGSKHHATRPLNKGSYYVVIHAKEQKSVFPVVIGQ
jgi:hypothetical protein